MLLSEAISRGSSARESVIIEWPKNGLFHDRCYVIITSRMVVISYDDQKSRSVIITESNDLEMTVSENHDLKS